MPQPLLIIVFDEKVAAPGFATAFEIITPMSPSRFLAEAGGGHDGRRHRHQVRRLPGLQAGLGTRQSGQLRQLCGASIKPCRIPQPSGVAAHGLLQRRNHGSIDESWLPAILRRRSAGRRRVLQPYRNPTSKDQAFQEGVRGQPIGAVHTGGCHLSAGVEADQVRRTIDVGLHASAEVVTRGRDRDQIGGGVDAGLAAAVPDGGEPHPPGLLAQHPAVDVDMINTVCRHLLHDLFGDNIARRQLSKLMLPDHEAFATGVDELAALAAYGLADKRQLAASARTEVEHLSGGTG